MSDSGRGSRGGRGGRGGRLSGARGSRFKWNKPTGKTQLSDYMYYLGSAKQAADFEMTTEYLVNYIKGSFDFGDDIGTALEKLEPFDASTHKPKLKASKKTNDKAKGAENRQFQIKFNCNSH